MKGWESGFLGPAEAFIQRSPCGAVSPTGPRNVGLGRRGAVAAIAPDPPTPGPDICQETETTAAVATESIDFKGLLRIVKSVRKTC